MRAMPHSLKNQNLQISEFCKACSRPCLYLVRHFHILGIFSVWFSYLCIRLGEQLLLFISFSTSIKNYFVKVCPILDDPQ